MPNISARSQAAPASPIRRLYPLAVEAKRRGKKVYHLNIGQPDIPTPESFLRGIREAQIKVLDYAPSPGIPEAIEAVRAYYAELGFSLASENILITIGGSEAITFALTVTCDPGDEVLIPEPFYPNYLGYARLTNVEILPLTTLREEGFHLPPRQELQARLTPRTKAIIVVHLAGWPADMEGIMALAERYGLWVIEDCAQA
ncbi:MAG: aminotransferase class I/II-fold pyridoxal phosphate-dependent enzyme, partial [Candidatus Bipolaricaulaceae bacterium]